MGVLTYAHNTIYFKVLARFIAEAKKSCDRSSTCWRLGEGGGSLSSSSVKAQGTRASVGVSVSIRKEDKALSSQAKPSAEEKWTFLHP